MNKITIKTEIIICLLLALFTIGVRAIHLDADPPIGLSISSDVYTDTPNLTLYAKHQINQNNFDQAEESKFPLFMKSSITVLAIFVYSLFGVSLASTNMIGLIFSLMGLFLFYLITRKAAGALGAILYLLLISLNYNQIFYGRLAFQEHSMIFWGALAIVLLLYSKNKYIALLSGVSLGCCIFFGKLIGVAFIFPFAVYFIYEIYSQKNKKLKTHLWYFIFGLILLTVSWIFFVYIPMQANVNSYLGEQISGNHGFPLAFESLSKFIGTYVTFGHISHLIDRNIIACFLASFFIIAFIYNNIPFKDKKEKSIEFNSALFFIVALAIAFYFFLMIWKYRPLRYQIVLIYPICALSAVLISRIWERKEIFKADDFKYRFLFLLMPLTILYSAFTVYIYRDILFNQFTYTLQQIIIYSGMVLYALIIYFVIQFYFRWNYKKKNMLLKYSLTILLFMALCMNGYRYYNWIIRPTYTLRDNNKDLNTILNHDAVLTGAYSSPLTIETKYNSVIHMFGVSNPDPEFFKKNHITHLLIDVREEKRAREDYPTIMNQAKTVLTYYISDFKVKLIRVAGLTGDTIADSYQLSTFEKLSLANDENLDTAFQNLYGEYTRKYPENISGYYLNATHALANANFTEVEKSILKSIEFSPTNIITIGMLGRYFKNLYTKTKVQEYKTKGLMYYEKALWLLPESELLNKEADELRSL